MVFLIIILLIFNCNVRVLVNLIRRYVKLRLKPEINFDSFETRLCVQSCQQAHKNHPAGGPFFVNKIVTIRIVHQISFTFIFNIVDFLRQLLILSIPQFSTYNFLGQRRRNIYQLSTGSLMEAGNTVKGSFPECLHRQDQRFSIDKTSIFAYDSFDSIVDQPRR